MSIRKGFFITGTDTDIGKTYISRLLVEQFSKTFPVTYMKPVQTGCSRNKLGELDAPDFDFVKTGLQIYLSETYDDHVPYRFEPACSPHLAAAMESTIISVDKIQCTYNKLSTKASYVFVEGAGGVLAPLNEHTYMYSICAHLQLSAIVVSSPHLGTINHTLLTLNHLMNSNCRVAGIVMNNCRNVTNDYLYHENIRYIKMYSADIPFLEVQYGEIDSENIKKFCIDIQ